MKEAKLVRLEQLRVNRVLHADHRQPGHRRGGLDRVVRPPRPVQHEQRQVRAPPERFHRHDRVDSATERDQGAQSGRPAIANRAVRIRLSGRGRRLRVFSIQEMREESARALDALESFAAASCAEWSDLDRSVRRPSLSETGAEVRRQPISAKDAVVDTSRAVGRATSRGAKHVSDAVREKTGEVFD